MHRDTKVKVLQYTNNPQKICAAASRLSHTKEEPLDIFNKIEENSSGKYIRNVLKMGHKSVMEHACFNIVFQNTSVFVEQFLIESRLASFTVKSRRYVNYGSAGYVIPKYQQPTDRQGVLFPSGEQKPYAIPEYYKDKSRKTLYKKYTKHMNLLFTEYVDFVKNGIPIEDARFVLPYSFKSSFFCTMNARELVHFLYSAIYGRGKAFAEIKWIAETLLRQLNEIAPNLFGPLTEIEHGEDNKEKELTNILKVFIPRRGKPKEKVELLYFTDNPDDKVALAAAFKNTLARTETIEEKLTSELKRKLIDIILNNARPRELEQVNFTFRINSISLPILTHITRHRMQSLIIPSFTEAGKSSEYVFPDSIKSISKFAERYTRIFEKSADFYQFLIDNGVPPEERIYAYLSGNTIDVLTTMNARELYHFFSLRTCNRAQWEIRQIANIMLSKAKKVAPMIFKTAGPNCVLFGHCTEGKKTCGLAKEMQKKYLSSGIHEKRKFSSFK